MKGGMSFYPIAEWRVDCGMWFLVEKTALWVIYQAVSGASGVTGS